MRSCQYFILSVMTVIALMLVCSSVSAATKLVRQIRFSATVTDNSDLDQSGSETDLITKLVPSFQLIRTGARGVLVVNGDLETEHFQRTGRTRFNPKLSTLGRRHILPDFLTFSGSAFVNQTSISSRLDGIDGFSNSAARSRVYGSTLGIGVTPDLGNDIELGARISASGNLADDDAETAGGSITTSASLIHNTPFGGFFYGVNGSYQTGKQRSDGTNDEGDADRFTTSNTVIGVTRISLGYNFTQNIGVVASWGESFIFNRLADNRSSDDAWQVAVRWSPNRRTNVIAGYSRTFSAGVPNLSVVYRLRNAQFSFQWSRVISLETEEFSDSLEFPGTGTDLQSDDEIEDLAEVDLPDSVSPFIEPVAFAAETASARMVISGRRTRITIFSIFSRSENSDDEFIFNNWSIGSSIFRPGRKGLSFRLDLARRGQSNVLGEPEFTENRLGITIRKKF